MAQVKAQDEFKKLIVQVERNEFDLSLYSFSYQTSRYELLQKSAG